MLVLMLMFLWFNQEDEMEMEVGRWEIEMKNHENTCVDMSALPACRGYC